jgi:hypothetical protein
MIRKASLLAVTALALLVAGVSTGANRRVATTAQSIHRYFQDLQGARNSIGPVERFVFSIVLASADRYPAEQQ